MGDLLKQRYVVYNAGQRTLVLTTTPWLSTELTRLHVVDQNDRDIETDRSSYSGAMPLDTCMLRPGEAIEIPLGNLSIGPGTFDHPRPDILKATAGLACRLRGKLQIQHIRSPEQGTSPIVDHLWLETGDVEFKVTKEKRGSPDLQPQDAAGLRKQLEQVQALEDAADAEMKTLDKHLDLLRHAAAGCEQLYNKHRNQLLGVYTRFYQACCLQKRGDEELAEEIFQELLLLPDETDAIQELKVLVRKRGDLAANR